MRKIYQQYGRSELLMAFGKPVCEFNSSYRPTEYGEYLRVVGLKKQ